MKKVEEKRAGLFRNHTTGLDEILHPDREERVSSGAEGGVRRGREGRATAAEGVDSCLRLKWFGQIFLEASASSGVPSGG